MTSADYILLLPIAFGLLIGFYRGFLKELASIVCVFVALFVARYLGESVALFVADMLNINTHISKSIAMALLFVATIFLVKLVADILTRLSETLMIGWLNRILGMALGGLKWLIIVSVIVNCIAFFSYRRDMKEQNLFTESKFYKPIKQVLSDIIPLLHFRDFIEIDIENQSLEQ